VSTEIAAKRFYWNRGVVGDGEGYSSKLSVKLLWEPRSVWVGAYWRKEGAFHWFIDLCILPCLPIRFHLARSYGGRYA
jgi:hypothetical protein